MHYISLVLSILLTQSAGIIGAIFTAQSVQGWYQTINKPTWHPPNWLFGPVWITLYTLMGIALWRIWEIRHAHESSTLALSLFGIQLLLNAIWSPIFFGLHSPMLGLIVITTLFVFLCLTMWAFWNIDHTSALLLVPYLLWVTFATFLNASIWRLN